LKELSKFLRCYSFTIFYRKYKEVCKITRVSIVNILKIESEGLNLKIESKGLNFEKKKAYNLLYKIYPIPNFFLPLLCFLHIDLIFMKSSPA